MRLLLVLAMACAKKSAPMYAAEESATGYGGAPAAEMDRESARLGWSDDAPAAPPPPPMVAMEPPPEPTPTPQPAPAQAQAQAQARMVHYDGWAQLRVPDPPETLDAVVALAEGAGGRTERLTGNTVSVRVPVEEFEEVDTPTATGCSPRRPGR